MNSFIEAQDEKSYTEFSSCAIFYLSLHSVMIYGFDNDKYLKIQSEHIKERIAKFGNKLYLELGGKLFEIGRAHV